MARSTIKAATAAAAALAWAGAAAAQPPAEFGPGDDGRRVRLFSPVFTVDLPANAGTGYHWEFGTAHSRNVVLVSRGPGAAPPHPPGAVGFPISQRFTLRATGRDGEVRIGLFPPGPMRDPQRVWRLTYHSAYADRSPPGRYD